MTPPMLFQPQTRLHTLPSESIPTHATSSYWHCFHPNEPLSPSNAPQQILTVTLPPWSPSPPHTCVFVQKPNKSGFLDALLQSQELHVLLRIPPIHLPQTEGLTYCFPASAPMHPLSQLAQQPSFSASVLGQGHARAMTASEFLYLPFLGHITVLPSCHSVSAPMSPA